MRYFRKKSVAIVWRLKITIIWLFSVFIIINKNVVMELSQINSVSLLRRRPFVSEWKLYNDTMAFIDDLPSKLDPDRISILIGHVPLTHTSGSQVVPVIKVSFSRRLCINYGAVPWFFDKRRGLLNNFVGIYVFLTIQVRETLKLKWRGTLKIAQFNPKKLT